MEEKRTILQETAPVHSTQNDGGESSNDVASDSSVIQADLVTFAKPTDPDNPKDWSVTRKWIITWILAATGFNRIMVSTIVAPALPLMSADLHMSSAEALMSMSIYLLATAVGPLVIAPLSEIYGRSPILHTTNAWFLLWNIVCGFVKSKQLLITARAFAGLGAGAAYVLAGSVIGDVWDAKHRGRSLGFSALIQNLAAAVGPIVGAYITEYTNWRWMFWSTSLLQGVIVVASIPTFRETYAPLILQRRALRLRKTTGNENLFSESENLVKGRTAGWIVQRSLLRPMRLLIFHPTVQIQALLAAFCYGITYLLVSTYSDLWTSLYGESISTSGLHYIAMCVGSILGAQIGGPLMEVTFRKLTARANGNWTPEFHLPLMVPGSLITVAGMLWYGWAAQKRAYWINVDLGSAVLSFGMQLMSMPLQAYIIDVYPEHASSAQAGTQLCRSLTAFGFPLFAPSMFASMGYGWAGTMLAFVSLVIGLPAPILIWKYGAKLRTMAKTSF